MSEKHDWGQYKKETVNFAKEKIEAAREQAARVSDAAKRHAKSAAIGAVAITMPLAATNAVMKEAEGRAAEGRAAIQARAGRQTIPAPAEEPKKQGKAAKDFGDGVEKVGESILRRRGLPGPEDPPDKRSREQRRHPERRPEDSRWKRYGPEARGQQRSQEHQTRTIKHGKGITG